VKKKQGLQRPSEKIMAAQRGESAPAPSGIKVTFQALAFGLTFQNYSSSLVRSGCSAEMEQIKADLGYDGAPILERLLIDEVAVCWLRMGEAEAIYSQIMSQVHTYDKAQYAEKRLTACMKRYTHICESLARMRRDIIPAVQVNIAGQQIVMGGKR
jgi:hypothetical protein